MDDGPKDFRRGKPQQKLYRPGSGPLRKSADGSDIKMEKNRIGSEFRGKHSGNCNDVTSNKEQGFSNNSKNKKPEQQLYVARSGVSCDNDKHCEITSRCDYSSLPVDRKSTDRQHTNSTGSRGRRDKPLNDVHNRDNASSDLNYNRNYRQYSEPRCSSPAHSNQGDNDRNRDSRSMEPTSRRHITSSGGGKPPSGRRNSAGHSMDYNPRHKHFNIDNLAPRFRKMYLMDSGHHSLDSGDNSSKDKYSDASINSQANTIYDSSIMGSQTLPSRGRGRLRDSEFDREKFMNVYMRNYEVHSTGRSTSSSCNNLYDYNAPQKEKAEQSSHLWRTSHHQDPINISSKNGCSNNNHETISQNTVFTKSNEKLNARNIEKLPQDITKCDAQRENKLINDVTEMHNNLLDITNLDWTEEVEKNIKLDDLNDSSASSPNHTLKSTSISQDIKLSDSTEPKRSGKSRQRDKNRNSNRSNKNAAKNANNAQQPSQNGKSDRNRRDSVQHEQSHQNQRTKERERRDSHRSNVSSTIGNSRDDLDRWRSLRSFSREHSNERRIVSQCNSRDTSVNRAMSPRHNDGFRIPAPVGQSNWHQNSQKSIGAWANARTPSVERGRCSPSVNVNAAGNNSGVGGNTGGGAGNSGGGGGNSGGGGGNTGGNSGGGEGGRKSKKKSGRRKGRNSENVTAPTTQITTNSSTNWREEILESKKNSRYDRSQETGRNKTTSISDKTVNDTSANNMHPGLIILPQNTGHELGRINPNQTQKTLYDYHNPSKPIIVQTTSAKEDMRLDRVGMMEMTGRGVIGASTGGSDAARAARHRALLQEVDRADAVLQTHMLRGPLPLAAHWPDVTDTRKSLQNALQRLLMSDLKFCQSDNVEHHFWKILYYNFIEMLRKSITQVSPDDKISVIQLINTVIEEGNIYFENLVKLLEKTYKFNTDSYINDNHSLPPKGLGFVGLALISVQKLYIFLGDLARYKEQVNETNNFAKSKLWYTRAQQINPKNGRPYNQLAILAIYARRKLDAVYYYMRSLMSSNPFHSARESLLSLFDENRKKYEAAERKRRAAREAATGVGGDATSSGHTGGSGRGLRREVWIRPSGGRTTTLRHDTRDEHLSNITSVELNKNFITSYLHVHGKLITKIGMESFHESAVLMLKQFRALLHQRPLPTPAARLLQLTALNIFAVETTTQPLKGSDSGAGAGERCAWVDCALGVSLLMFGALLERCCALLPEQPSSQQHADALVLLPAIKVWSDWMLCHSSVWNPPPSLDSFVLGVENDPWIWLAKFMNILEALDDKSIVLETEAKEGTVSVRLPEDASLAGFTPLMYIEPASCYVSSELHLAPHLAEHALRTRKLLFFGTEYLVGVEPPVLRLEYPPGEAPLYASAVQRRVHDDEPLQELSEDSEGEDTSSAPTNDSITETLRGSALIDSTDEATRRLLKRKEQLEVRRATVERRRQRMQEILRGGWVSVEVEVRPRWLVPDTNCFIDHLPLLQRVLAAPGLPYQLAVPLVVVTELEGLSRCGRVGTSASAALQWLSEAAAAAGIRYVTSRGTLLASRNFTAENASQHATNDDRVLAAALSLHANITSDTENLAEGSGNSRRVREVVLLTDDRNLRVKALAAEMPARDLPAFLQWAALPVNTTT